MNTPHKSATKPAQRYLIGVYFVLTYLVSWTGAFLVASPYIFQHKPVPKSTGLLIFPVMLLGPSLVGLTMIGMTAGTAGLKSLLSRMSILRVPVKWYASLLIPPALIAAVLFALKTFVSPAYAPNNFFIGLSFGIAAGFLEEIGWTGYLLPQMLLGCSAFRAGPILGLLWGLWHLPVVDFLGAAFPHGNYLLPFIAAFIAAMMAIRTIIVWVYSHTRSLIVAQLIHAVSTGSLVALGPPSVTPAQETIWYVLYAAVLWAAVAGIYLIQRRNAS